MKALRAELTREEVQVRQIEEVMGNNKSDEEGMRIFEERYRAINAKFPQVAEDAIRELSELARKHNIELHAIRPQPVQPFLDEENKAAGVTGFTCKLLPVSMEMTCSFLDLVRYIRLIKEAVPAFITVERLRITKDDTVAMKLRVYMENNIYLLIYEKGFLPAPGNVQKKTAQDTFLKRMEEEGRYLELKRDPFTGQLLVPQVTISKGISLNGILWDIVSPMAIINDEVVKIGDRVQGSAVIGIEKDKVILHDGTAPIELRLSP